MLGEAIVPDEGAQQERLQNLVIQRFANSLTQRWEYVLVNHDQPALHINRLPAPASSVYGPLPEFYIIEQGEAVMFWWRSIAALEYEPSLPGQTTEDPNAVSPA